MIITLVSLHKRLYKPLGKTNVRKFTVANKGLDIIYNSLTDDIRDIRSMPHLYIFYLYIRCKHIYSIDDVKPYFLAKIFYVIK